MSLNDMTAERTRDDDYMEMPASLADGSAFEEPPKPSLLRRVVVRIRLLPLVIFFSTLMLTVRVGDIWQGVDGALNGTVTVSSSEALAQTQGASAPGQAPVTPGQAALPKAGGLSSSLDVGGASAPVLAKEDRAAIAARMLADDPTLLTQSEIDLLQKLAERRVNIDARAKELDSREVMIAAAESRIDRKIKEFKALQATIETLVTKYDQQQSAKLASLVKIYENMKPKDAARIFEGLDMDTLLLVAERMKERKLAPVMAKMKPQRARDITVELNQLRTLPIPTKSGG